MAKRSHKVASRQAAVSRERKRKKKQQAAPKRPAAAAVPAPARAAPPPQPAAEASPEPAAVVAVPRPAAEPRQSDTRYRYVMADLRRIGIIAGAMIVILIVLAVVLG